MHLHMALVNSLGYCFNVSSEVDLDNTSRFSDVCNTVTVCKWVNTGG